MNIKRIRSWIVLVADVAEDWSLGLVVYLRQAATDVTLLCKYIVMACIYLFFFFKFYLPWAHCHPRVGIEIKKE